MESFFPPEIFQLGGTVVTVALFIWYLHNRNGKHDRALGKLYDGLDGLQKAQERHTRVLINVAKSHKLQGDADELTQS